MVGFGCDVENAKITALTIDPTKWSDCFKDAICDIVKKHCDLCEWICQNCDQFAAPSDCVENQCSGGCTWRWVSGSWQSVSNTCAANVLGCGCAGEPTQEQIDTQFGQGYELQEGDEITIPCETLPPEDCNNCGDCGTGAGTYFYLTQLSATVVSEQGGISNDSWSMVGPSSNQTLRAGCTWTVPIAWASGATGCATAKYEGPDAGGASQGKWTVSVDATGENGVSGNWTTLSKPAPPQVDCTFTGSGDDVEQGGNGPQDFGYVSAVSASGQIGICPFTSTDADCGGGGNAAAQTVSIDEAVLNTDRIDLRVIATSPEIVSGCSCRKDVLAVMRRWKPGQVTDSQIAKVAETIAAKTPSMKRSDIFDKIKAVVN